MENERQYEWLRPIPWIGAPIADRLRRTPVVAVLRLSGPVGQVGALRRGGLSIAELAGPIEKACRTPNLAALALVVNSPGGSPVQAAQIARRVRDHAEERGIPVFAFCEDVAASGGYWLACAGNEIYADAASIVGSIGVVYAGFGFTDLLTRIGVERRLHTAGERKAILDPFKPEKPEDVALLRDLQDDIHAQFRDFVRTRRGERLRGSEEELFSGAFWTGRKALDLGLIDGLGDVRTVMREKYGKDVRLRTVHIGRSWLQRQLGRSAEAGAAALAGTVMAAVEERALWARYGR